MTETYHNLPQHAALFEIQIALRSACKIPSAAPLGDVDEQLDDLILITSWWGPKGILNLNSTTSRGNEQGFFFFYKKKKGRRKGKQGTRYLMALVWENEWMMRWDEGVLMRKEGVVGQKRVGSGREEGSDRLGRKGGKGYKSGRIE